MDSKIESASIEEELEKHGVYASTTKGVSMEPLFRTHRDMVIIEKPQGELRRYDVALYRSGGRYVLHRVIRVRDGYYLIRGDNTYRDERIPKDAILGVLTGFNRKGKRGTVKDRSFRCYSVIWTNIYPLRFIWCKCKSLAFRGLGKIKRVLFGKNKRKKR